jgi:hypothetical protein
MEGSLVKWGELKAEYMGNQAVVWYQETKTDALVMSWSKWTNGKWMIVEGAFYGGGKGKERNFTTNMRV